MKIMRRGCCVLVLGFICLLASVGFCDILHLKDVPKEKEGNEVEILEEKEDSFIVKIPKEEVDFIKRKRPTEMKLWKEKKILWEDTGDYLMIYLPKEKIVAPEGAAANSNGASGALKEQLQYAGQVGSPSEAAFWKGAGKVKGRILKSGMPLEGAKIKIACVSGQVDTLSRIFGPRDDEAKAKNYVFETTSDGFGGYEFNNVPLGEYDIYWVVPGAKNWFRRLSEKADIAVRPGETTEFKDIETVRK